MRTDGWAAVCLLGEGDARGREELELLWFLAWVAKWLWHLHSIKKY